MLWRCLSTVRALGGYGNTTATIQASYSPDTYKFANKLSIPSLGNQYHSKKLTRVHEGSTSAYKQVPSHADQLYVNNDPPPQTTSLNISAEPMPRVRPSHPDKTNSCPTPIDTLRTILSPRITRNPQTYNSDTLISLMTSVQADGQLSKLSPNDISSLISLLGTLSIYPATTHMYDNPLASRVTSQSPRTYWSFIAQLAQEKVRLRLGLTPSDHYWLMRVELAIVNYPDRGQLSVSGPLQKHDAMSRATRHYRFIRRHSIDPEVHGPYFEALHSLQTAGHLDVAVKFMRELLSWSYTLHHPRLLAILWRILLKPAVELCPKSKEALLTAFARRLHRHAKALSQARCSSNHSIPKSSVPGVLNTSNDPIRHGYGIVDLANAFRAAIFSPLPFWMNEADSYTSQSYKWALSQALVAFAPQRPLADRWNSLILFALCSPTPVGSSASTGSVTQREGNSDKVDTGDWDVICVLAAMRKSFNRMGYMSILDQPLEKDVQSLSKTLCTTWLEDSEARPKPHFVARAVAASFFWLAAIAKDASLTDAVARHCTSSKLWSIGPNVKSEVMQAASLATEYVGASLVCGTGSLEHLIMELHDAFRGSRWPPVIRQMISDFGDREIRVAVELYILAKQNTDLPMDISYSSTGMLTAHRFVDVALPFLRDLRVSQSQTRELLDAVLLSLTKRRDTSIHPDIANVVGGVMHTLYAVSPPSPLYRAVIPRILLVLVSSNRGARAGAIFHAIRATSPSFFSEAFILCFSQKLIRHRQFRAVTQIVEALSTSQSPGTARLRKVVVLGLARGGASTLAMRVSKFGRNSDDLVRMARAVRFRVEASSPMSSLKISTAMEKYAWHGPVSQFATLILVRAGRILAAKRLFRSTTLDPRLRTSLVNVILDGYIMRLSTRNGQHMRKILSAYNFFLREGVFVPDRVTVNTLLKAILRWRNMMDSGKLRALFDHLVRNGYPGGEKTSGSCQVPFGTPESFRQVFQLPQFDQPISFERHIRPMLKMFIKAFQVRGDVAAARQIIGILKSEGEKLQVVKQRRARKS